MRYEVHILDVGDADAIVIKYKPDMSSRWITAVIDAGNEGDGKKVKKCIKSDTDGKYRIDYAFCTHPDKDHKGGFFDLFDDSDVVIKNLCLLDPWEYLEKDDFTRVRYNSSAKEKARAPFCSSSDISKNLIDIAERKGILRIVHAGDIWEDIPLTVVGPIEEYYRECVLGMVERFAELKDDPDFESFDDQTFPDLDAAKSVIDKVEDESYTNKASMVLLFNPNNEKFLLCGDVSCSSLNCILKRYGRELLGCRLKVPHHGSKHNLTTNIIDLLKPVSAVISAKGTQKHPNSAIVTSLSRYCNVYSTHKSGWLIYRSEPASNPATPLKPKILASN